MRSNVRIWGKNEVASYGSCTGEWKGQNWRRKRLPAWPITPEKTGFESDYDTLEIETNKANNMLDMFLIDLKMTALFRWILLNNGIDTMRDLSRISADEIKAFRDMTEEVYKDQDSM